MEAMTPSTGPSAVQVRPVLVLDPKHPGLHDTAYVQRRQQLHDWAFDYRVGQLGFPHVDYTEDEHALWRHISERLVEAHQRHACELYLRGKALLNIESKHMPQLGDLDRALQEKHGFGLVPAEGLLDVRLFFEYLRRRRMPVTQFLRYHKVPDFTPEPDAVHDVTGHVPCLIDPTYQEVVQRIGEGVLSCPEADVPLWSRLYWFTVEFGLVEERGEPRVLGAGLLSSLEEIEYCFTDAVSRRPFELEEVIHTDYDPTCKQQTVFVVPSLRALAEDVARLRTRKTLAVG